MSKSLSYTFLIVFCDLKKGGAGYNIGSQILLKFNNTEERGNGGNGLLGGITMKNDYKKMMNIKAKQRSKVKHIVISTAIATSFMVSTYAIPTMLPFMNSGVEVQAAVINGQLFTNLNTNNSSGTTFENPFPYEGQTRDVDFTITGSGVLEVSALNGQRRVVLAIPEPMQGLVTPRGEGTLETSILLPADGLLDVFTYVDAGVSTFVSVVDAIVNDNPLLPVTINMDEVYEQLDLLQTLSEINNAEIPITFQMQGDEYIYSNIDGSLEILIRDKVTEILNNLNDAVQSLTATGLGAAVINPLLGVPKAVFDGVITTAIGMVNIGSALLGNVVDGSVLGETTALVPTTIQDPNPEDLLAANIDLSQGYEADHKGMKRVLSELLCVVIYFQSLLLVIWMDTPLFFMKCMMMV